MAARIVALSQATTAGPTLAIGDFDGLHAGHRPALAGADAALSLRRARDGRRLTPTDVEAELMAVLGVGTLIVDDCPHLPLAVLVSDVALGRLGARAVRLPEEAVDGAEPPGDERVAVLPGERRGGRLISAPWIRQLVEAGSVAEAAELLGRPYELRGTVVEGDRRGRTLGFPTANLAAPADAVCPALGVYARRAPGAGPPP